MKNQTVPLTKKKKKEIITKAYQIQQLRISGKHKFAPIKTKKQPSLTLYRCEQIWNFPIFIIFIKNEKQKKKWKFPISYKL